MELIASLGCGDRHKTDSDSTVVKYCTVHPRLNSTLHTVLYLSPKFAGYHRVINFIDFIIIIVSIYYYSK